MNGSMNESIHKNIKEQINIKIEILPRMNESMNESIHKNIKKDRKDRKDLPKIALFISLKKSFSKSFFTGVS